MNKVMSEIPQGIYLNFRHNFLSSFRYVGTSTKHGSISQEERISPKRIRDKLSKLIESAYSLRHIRKISLQKLNIPLPKRNFDLDIIFF